MTRLDVPSKHALVLLRRQTAAARLRLTAVQAELSRAEERLAGNIGAQLVEANAELVETVLRAQAQSQRTAEALRAAAHSAETDALTGLPNRLLLRDRLRQAMMLARRRGTMLALLFLDLDGFKHVNDSLGHAAGDQALCRIAAALLSAVRESDTVSRHGGDEFVLLLTHIDGGEAAVAVARKVIDAISVPWALNGHAVQLTASIGISLYPQDGTDPGLLLEHADAAMYRAKQARPGSVVFHGAEQAQLAHVGSDGHGRHQALLLDANQELLLRLLDLQTVEQGARKAQERQSEFMAVIGHEMRNPMAVLTNAAALLVHPGASHDASALIGKVVARQIPQLARLVEDLLQANHAGAAGFVIERRPIDLVRVIEVAVEACRGPMELRRQRLTVRGVDAALMIDGDAVRLAQVLRNLLDNACKYTPDGGTIEVTAQHHAGMVQVVVADSGIGIAPEALAGMFELFVRDPRAVDIDPRGLGIGLAVVRQLVQAHGGQVEARSAGVGQGSQFVLTLPLAQ